MKYKTGIVFVIILLIIIFLVPIKTKYEWFIDGELVFTKPNMNFIHLEKIWFTNSLVFKKT